MRILFNILRFQRSRLIDPHALEKILARAAGEKYVKRGDIITCKVDLAEVNDLYLQVIQSFHEMGGTKVAHPESVAFVFDHYSPAPTIKSAENYLTTRDSIRRAMKSQI